MASDWITYKVGDICKSVSITHRFGKDKLIFLNTGDIEKGKILHRRYSDIDDMPGQAKKSIQKNDILLSEIRPANGRWAFVDFECDDYVVSTKLMVIRAERIVLPKYLYYYLTSPEVVKLLQHLAESRSGTFPQITFTQVSELDIQLPPIDKQVEIVALLESLDNKLENNDEINNITERIAQTIFKEWFVNFNYPGADGRMQQSELGEIPEGWRVLPLDEIASFLNGIAAQKYPTEDDKNYLPVIKIRELKSGNTANADKASVNVPEKYIVNNGDLLFSWSGTLETDFWTGGKGLLNQHLFKVTSENYPLWFCYLWIQYHLTEFRKIAEDKTTTMGHIQRKHLSEALCLVPDNMDSMNEVLFPLFDAIITSSLEINTISQIRDNILPKLITGEIEI